MKAKEVFHGQVLADQTRWLKPRSDFRAHSLGSIRKMNMNLTLASLANERVRRKGSTARRSGQTWISVLDSVDGEVTELPSGLAIHFVNEAFRHGKPIAFIAEGKLVREAVRLT